MIDSDNIAHRRAAVNEDDAADADDPDPFLSILKRVEAEEGEDAALSLLGESWAEVKPAARQLAKNHTPQRDRGRFAHARPARKSGVFG